MIWRAAFACMALQCIAGGAYPQDAQPASRLPAAPAQTATAPLRAARKANPALSPLATRLASGRRSADEAARGAMKTYSNGLTNGRAH